MALDHEQLASKKHRFSEFNCAGSTLLFKSDISRLSMLRVILKDVIIINLKKGFVVYFLDSLNFITLTLCISLHAG